MYNSYLCPPSWVNPSFNPAVLPVTSRQNYSNLQEMITMQHYETLLETQRLKSLLQLREQQIQCLIRNPSFSSIHINADNLEHSKNEFYVEAVCKEESLESQSFKVNLLDKRGIETESFITQSEDLQPHINSPQLVSHIDEMVSFILHNLGRAPQYQIDHQRQSYAFNNTLIELFDALVDKFSSAAKCREDMIRHVLRKALSYFKNSLRDKHKISSRGASVLMCQQYFQAMHDQMREHDIDMQDEDKILDFLLPYKKNSRNKTVNISFITEVFSSEAFYQDYVGFLDKLEKLFSEDNKKKSEKFIRFLVRCVEDGTVHEVRQFKRLPWLDQWLEATKVIAYELLDARTWKITDKNLKETKFSNKKKIRTRI